MRNFRAAILEDRLRERCCCVGYMRNMVCDCAGEHIPLNAINCPRGAGAEGERSTKRLGR